MNKKEACKSLPIVWQPHSKDITQSRIYALMQKEGLSSYAHLYQKSITDVAGFWDLMLKELNIVFDAPYSQVMNIDKGIALPQWCVDGKMNIITSCLDKWLNSPQKDAIALKFEAENGAIQNYTYQELHQEVCKCANALKSLGIEKGDVVGLFMPMTPEIVVAFLATLKVGAILLPLFSGYGAAAIVARMNDAKAKFLFTADGCFRRGKFIDMKSIANEASAQIPSLKHQIVSKYGNANPKMEAKRDFWWHEIVPKQANSCPNQVLAAEDTALLLYTSGTTGQPKGIVHAHCGFPVKAAMDMGFCMDVHQNESFWWMTDMGWMMGPWLIFGALINGASLFLFDGAPDFPHHHRTWELTEKHQITHLGLSPVLIRSLKEKGTDGLSKFDFSRLRACASTGSPWDEDSWMWLFENILSSQKPILNYSGGTEISGGIVCGNFLQPLKATAFSGAALGMAADVVNEKGESVKNEIGELVIRQPWIGMARGFWQNEAKYIETYWSAFPNIWQHGDFAKIDEDSLWYILGRSDDTLKISGKRLGPAEPEALLNAHPAVLESACIGIPHPVKGDEPLCFVVLNTRFLASEALRAELMQMVINGLGKALKPKAIKFVTALPKTRNAKVMHRLIKAIYLGNPIGDTSSLEHPETLKAIQEAY